MPRQNQNQKSQSAFKVSFASKGAKQAFDYCRSDASNKDAAQFRPVPKVPTGARLDLNMKKQLFQAVERAAVSQKDWADENAINVARLPGVHEKHHLKILIRFAVLRQQKERSTHLSSVILCRSSANQANAVAHPELANSNTKKKHVTEAQAFDLDFVVKKLMEDIDIVYKRHGYKVTLQAFSELHPWQL